MLVAAPHLDRLLALCDALVELLLLIEDGGEVVVVGHLVGQGIDRRLVVADRLVELLRLVRLVALRLAELG